MNTGIVSQFPIEKEYEKNPQITPEDIKNLRDWLMRQPHLPGEHITDLELMLTYHCCEQSAEVSKQVLDLHFTLRTLFTALYKDRDFDKKVEHSLNTVLFAPLPTPSVNDYRIIYIHVLDADPKNFMFSDLTRCFLMSLDLWQYEEGTWPGFCLIIDLEQVVIGHLARLDLMTIQQILYFLQEALLVRLKEFHFLNAPSFMDKLMMLLKPFMKKELQEMIRIHQIGSDTVYKYIPKAAFPKEAGGEYKHFKVLGEEVVTRIKNNRSFFKEESKKRVQESLRPGKPKSIGTIFGIEGSFKKLDID